MVKSKIQQDLERLEESEKTLNCILSVAKTNGGHISEHGKNLYFILKEAGLKKSEIARILNVTPAALSKYG